MSFISHAGETRRLKTYALTVLIASDRKLMRQFATDWPHILNLAIKVLI
jgi:hypothetical protein